MPGDTGRLAGPTFFAADAGSSSRSCFKITVSIRRMHSQNSALRTVIKVPYASVHTSSIAFARLIAAAERAQLHWRQRMLDVITDHVRKLSSLLTARPCLHLVNTHAAPVVHETKVLADSLGMLAWGADTLLCGVFRRWRGHPPFLRATNFPAIFNFYPSPPPHRLPRVQALQNVARDPLLPFAMQ